MNAVAVSVRTRRHQVGIALAALIGVYAVVFGPGVLLALGTLVSGRSATTASGWWGGLAALEWDVFGVGVVTAVVVRWLPRQAPVVTQRMGLGRTRQGVPGGLVGAAAVFVAVATLSVAAGDRIVAVAGLPAGGNTQVGAGASGLLLGLAASVSAAVTEELVLVALAVAVVSAARPRAAVPLTLALMVVLRLLPHLYYGWASMFVVLWTVGAYALFRWAGSVWPLVIGHGCYDVLVTIARAYEGTTRLAHGALWAVTMLGCAVAVAGLLTRTRRDAPALTGG